MRSGAVLCLFAGAFFAMALTCVGEPGPPPCADTGLSLDDSEATAAPWEEDALIVRGRWVYTIQDAPPEDDCCSALELVADAGGACVGYGASIPPAEGVLDSWEIQPLFADAGGPTSDDTLSRYCLATHLDQGKESFGGDEELLEELLEGSLGPGASQEAPYVRERAVTIPLEVECEAGDPACALTERARLNAAEEFDVLVGAVGNLADLAGALGGGAEVRLEILDTSVTDKPEQGVVDHGKQGFAIAERLLCTGPGDCLVDVQTRLALPLDPTRVDLDGPYGWLHDLSDGLGFDVRDLEVGRAEGGQVGPPSFVAQAIYEAVEEAGESHRLILALPLGISPLHVDKGANALGFDEYSPEIASLRDALIYARDAGALVIAAAGNPTLGAFGQTKQLYPAGWSEQVPPLGDDGVRAPLVYAAGGFNRLNFPLSRPEGLPPFNTYIENVAADPQYRALTGTSVSAYVLASAAALVWSVDTARSADDVMGVLYGSGDVTWGDGLGRAAEHAPLEFSTFFGDTTARRISPVEALRAACPGCGVADPAEGFVAPLKEFHAAFSASSVEAGCYYEVAPPVCEVGVYADAYYGVSDLSILAGPPHPCPGAAWYGASALPIVIRQPGEVFCPPCEADLFYQKIRVINMGEDPAQAVLNVHTNNGERRNYHLGFLDPHAPATFLMNHDELEGLEWATVTFFGGPPGGDPHVWFSHLRIFEGDPGDL